MAHGFVQAGVYSSDADSFAHRAGSIKLTEKLLEMLNHNDWFLTMDIVSRIISPISGPA